MLQSLAVITPAVVQPDPGEPLSIPFPDMLFKSSVFHGSSTASGLLTNPVSSTAPGSSANPGPNTTTPTASFDTITNSFQDKPGEVTVLSADGVEVTVRDRSRIATLGGAVTETVYALGYGDQLIASDQSSTYPEEVFRKPRLTVFRTSTPESILSLNPSLILTTEGIRPLSVPTQLRNAGVPTLLLKEAKTPEEAAERMRKIGKVLEEEEKAEEIISAMLEDLERAHELQEQLPRKPRVLFVYTRGAYMVNVTGRGTSADAVIRLAGGINVVDQFEGYRPLTAEAVVTSAPDLILVPEFWLEMLGGMTAFLNQPGISLTPAAKNGHILAIDDAMLLSFGPRLGQGVYQLTSEMIRVLEEKQQ
ncbi:MAG: heme/hemin ABC transporter substrate-binding protein [Balneolaceae bacterium]